MSPLESIIFVIGLAGFLIAFFIQFSLNQYISKEKALPIKDPEKLWQYQIPPREILSEEGQKLHRLVTIGRFLFLGSIALMFILD